MKELLLQIFGEYEPVTVSVISDAGEEVKQIVGGVAGIDWPYVLGVLLFALVLWSFFRLLGVILK